MRWECVKTFDEPACVIVKHANPGRSRSASTPPRPTQKAQKTDPTSAYGGIVAFNRPFDGAAAEAIHATKQFVEVLLAPAITAERARCSPPSPTHGCSRPIAPPAAP